jgi:nucleotide-binding universal stress UspA family protein
MTMAPAVDTWTLPPGYYEQWQESVAEQARLILARALHALQTNPELEITSEVLNALPKDALIDEAKRWQADLVVVGSHGYGGLKRLWLGSVSQAVAAHACCSVEIVRERGAASHE